MIFAHGNERPFWASSPLSGAVVRAIVIWRAGVSDVFGGVVVSVDVCCFNSVDKKFI